MTCTRMGGAIVCTSPWGRLHLGKHYVWVDFHEYCGPAFYWDAAMSREYEPADERDPIWPLFDAWLVKYRAGKEKAARARGRA